MLTISLMIGTIFYGLLALHVWGIIWTGQYQANEVAPMLLMVFIFGGIFFIALFEAIRNLQKGIWR